MNLSFSCELLEASINNLLHDLDINNDGYILTGEIAEWLVKHRELVIDLGLSINSTVNTDIDVFVFLRSLFFNIGILLYRFYFSIFVKSYFL